MSHQQYHNQDQLSLSFCSSLLSSSNLSDRVSIVQIDPATGKGLVSLQHFQVGQTVINDTPIVSMQLFANREATVCCFNCFRFLGSSKTLIDFLNNVKSLPADSVDLMALRACLVSTGESIQCIYGCGELFCSQACHDMCLKKHHRMLCVGRLTSVDHPLMRFKQHAIENNELFLLAAQYVSFAVLSSTLNLDDLANFSERSVSEQREIFEQRLREVTFPVTSVVMKKPWWEVIDTTKDVSQSELMQLSKESYELMVEALRSQFAFLVEERNSQRMEFAANEWERIQEIFSYELFVNMLGMFDLNNHAIETENTLQKLYETLSNDEETNATLLAELKELSGVYRRITGMDDDHNHGGEDDHEDDHDHDMEEDEHEEEEDGEEDGEMEEEIEPIFPRFEGIGLFLIACSCNHSCEPNAVVTFPDNNIMSLIAKREIRQGEQIFHSYISETQSVADRACDLKEYGFVCNCPKCQREKTQ